MASSCAVFNPASCARTRVTVKSVCGSMFMLRFRSGEFVVDLPFDANCTCWSIVPSVSPWKVTLDFTLVMRRSAEKGFASETVVCAMSSE